MGLFGSDKQAPEFTRESQPVTPSRASQAPAATTSGRSVLSKACQIEGTISSSDDLAIEGQVSGTVETTGHLMVAAGGSMKADLHGRNVTIAGKVNGNVTADEKIELEPSAKVAGNITAPRILIKDGATFEGQVFMKSPARKGADMNQPKAQPNEQKPTHESGNKNGKGK